MRRTLFTLACWMVLAPIAAQKDVSAAPSKTLRPNILIIFTDDNDELPGDIAQKDAKIAEKRFSNPPSQTTKNHGKSREIQGN